MKKGRTKSLLTFAFFCLHFILHAQIPPCQWAQNAGSATADLGTGIATFYNGDVYVTGQFTGANVDFDPGPGVASLTSNGGTDIFVAKYDSTGNYQWAFNIGGVSSDKGSAITVDMYGDVYVTGYYAGANVDFDPGSSTANQSSTGSNDGFLAKYSPGGQYIWAISLGGASGADEGFGVATDDSIAVYITGSLGSTNADFDPSAASAILNSNGGDDIFVAKYLPNGNYQWAFAMGSAGNFNERAYAIASDDMGFIYITGQLDGTGFIDVDPSISTHNLAGGGGTDFFVAKYDGYGHYQWAFDIAGPNADFGSAICSDGWGNILVTGKFEGTNLDFDPGVGVQPLSSNASADAFVVSYSPSGTYNWAFPIGSTSNADGGTGVSWDGLGNAIITGYFSGTADFDPSANVANLASNGMEDFYLAKYDNAGQYIWALSVGDAASDDVATAVAVDMNTNSPVITGFFYGTAIDFDASAATVNLTSYGADDIFIAKYSSCWGPPPSPQDISGPIVVCEGSTQTYFVAPIPQATGYTWTLPGGWSGNSNTNTITVTVGNQSGTIYVTADNPCGSSPPTTLTVTVTPPPVITYMQTPSVVCVDDAPFTLSPASPPGGTYSGPGVNGTTFNPLAAGAGYDTVTYHYIDTGGCVSTSLAVIQVLLCTGVPAAGVDEQLQVYPNPCDEQLTLTIAMPEGAQAIIYNMVGEEVLAQELENGVNVMDTRSLAPGMYVLKVIGAGGVVESKLIRN